MILAFDTYYYDGYSYTVCAAFDNWASEKAKFHVTNRRKGIDAEYVPGELYKRELPCIMQCLSRVNVNNVTSIIVDGFSWVVDEDGKQVPGLGKRLQDAILDKYGHYLSVIGVAKNPYHKEIPFCHKVFRGESSKPLYVTCTENEFAEHYAVEIKLMHGKYRIPDILKEVDTRTRSYCEEIENDCSCIDRLIRENNKLTSKEEEDKSHDPSIDFSAFDKWVAETEKNGFVYRDVT